MILDNRTRYRSADLERAILLALEEAGITSHARDRVLVTCNRSGYSGYCYFGDVKPRKLARGGRRPRMKLRLPDPNPPESRYHYAVRHDLCPNHIQHGPGNALACVPDGEVPPELGLPPGSRYMRCPKGCRWIQEPSNRVEPKPQADRPLDIKKFVWLVRHEVGHWRGLKHTQMAPTMRKWKAWKEAGCPLPEWAKDLSVGIEEALPVRPKKPGTNQDAVRAERVKHASEMLAKAERKAKLAETLVKRWSRRLKVAQTSVLKAAARAEK